MDLLRISGLRRRYGRAGILPFSAARGLCGGALFPKRHEPSEKHRKESRASPAPHYIREAGQIKNIGVWRQQNAYKRRINVRTMCSKPSQDPLATTEGLWPGVLAFKPLCSPRLLSRISSACAETTVEKLVRSHACGFCSRVPRVRAITTDSRRFHTAFSEL